MAGLVEGAVVVVTGGSSGNGRAISVRMAEEGATAVVVADIRERPREGGEPTVTLVEKEGARSAFVSCDVSRPDELRSAVAAADQFGGVTVMVNNAGIFRSENFLEVTEAEYDTLMDINVKGTFFGAQAAARSMIDAGRTGCIINLSSVAGLRGSSHYATYNTSKGAVRLLTMALADALGPRGIRVNAIHPGFIETEMTRTDVPMVGPDAARGIPLQRTGQPRDVADAAVYLASDLSAYVTGSSLLVDGGMLRI